MNASYQCARTAMTLSLAIASTSPVVAQTVTANSFHDLDTLTNFGLVPLNPRTMDADGQLMQVASTVLPNQGGVVASLGNTLSDVGDEGVATGNAVLADGTILSTALATPLLQSWSGAMFLTLDGGGGSGTGTLTSQVTIDGGPLATGDYLWTAFVAPTGDPGMNMAGGVSAGYSVSLDSSGNPVPSGSPSGFVSSGTTLTFGMLGTTSVQNVPLGPNAEDKAKADGVAFFSYVGPLSSTIPIGGAVPGDVDWDGVKDANDIDLLSMAIGAGIDDPRFNLDGLSEPAIDIAGNPFNDPVTQADLDYLIQVCFGTAYGDANLDGVVDLLDFNILAINFGSTDVGWSQGDVNRTSLAGPTAGNPGGSPPDFTVDLLDFDILAQNFGFGLPATVPGAVPEPASAALLGLAGLLIARRRRG